MSRRAECSCYEKTVSAFRVSMAIAAVCLLVHWLPEQLLRYMQKREEWAEALPEETLQTPA